MIVVCWTVKLTLLAGKNDVVRRMSVAASKWLVAISLQRWFSCAFQGRGRSGYLVLVSFHMAQDRHRVEGGKGIKDLHLDVSFGKECSAGGSIGELKGGLEPFQEALTVRVSGEEEGRVSGDVEPPEMEYEA
jgi:hypothetical protein